MPAATAPTSSIASADWCRRSWRHSPVDLYDLEHIGLDDVDVIVRSRQSRSALPEIDRAAARRLSRCRRTFPDQRTSHAAVAAVPFALHGGQPETLHQLDDPAGACRAPISAAWISRTFHRWEGILGQYARGYSDPPSGAQRLCLIGGANGRRSGRLGLANAGRRQGVHAQWRRHRDVLLRPAPPAQSLP